MKPISFLIPTIGSRGDLQPYIALASHLKEAGHHPIVASHPCMAGIARTYGVDFKPIGPDIDIGSEAAHMRANAPHWMVGMMRVMKFSFKMLEESHEDILALAKEAEVMIVSHTSAGSIEADQLGLEKISVTLHPQAIPVDDPDDPLIKKVIGAAAGWGMNLMMKKPLDKIRKRLGLPAMGPEGITSKKLNLIPISPHVFPPESGWEDRHQMTGYWFAEPQQSWTPPEDLAAYLADGDPPAVISLGAMALGDADEDEIIDLTLAAVQKAGVRAIIQGWDSQLAERELPPEVFHAGSVPHTWLLPQACCFVHHGGFGSVAAAFQAGIPALVIPHIIDQFIWGQKVQELGVGAAPIARGKLGLENYSEALVKLVTDTTLRENAARLGEKIREEQGLENARRLIEAVCG